MKPEPARMLVLGIVISLWLVSATGTAAGQDPSSAQNPSEEVSKVPPSPKNPAAEPNSATKPSPRTPHRSGSKGIRTLDEITIEGEIAVPQVLFIMARERQRYQDHLHRLYLKSSLEIGRETTFPGQLGIGLRP